jgi:hypothetical protein
LKNDKKNGLLSYEQLREVLQMTALQTAENAKQIMQTQQQLDKNAKEWRKELRESRAEHAREMKEIRVEFKKMIKRLAF